MAAASALEPISVEVGISYCLYESAHGYSIFAIKNRLIAATDFNSFCACVELREFDAFENCESALENVNAVSDGVVTLKLQKLLERALPAALTRLGVCDPTLGAAITAAVPRVECDSSPQVQALYRPLRVYFTQIVKADSKRKAAAAEAAETANTANVTGEPTAAVTATAAVGTATANASGVAIPATDRAPTNAPRPETAAAAATPIAPVAVGAVIAPAPAASTIRPPIAARTRASVGSSGAAPPPTESLPESKRTGNMGTAAAVNLLSKFLASHAAATPATAAAATTSGGARVITAEQAAAAGAVARFWGERSDVQNVWANLWITNFFGAKKKSILQEKKITHVVVCAREFGAAHPNDFKYKLLPLADQPTQDIAQYFSETFEWIDAAIAGGGQVLIHCAAGASRSASILIGYVMWKYRVPYDEVLTKTKAVRSNICPNWGFEAQLRTLQQNDFKCQTGTKTTPSALNNQK